MFKPYCVAFVFCICCLSIVLLCAWYVAYWFAFALVGGSDFPPPLLLHLTFDVYLCVTLVHAFVFHLCLLLCVEERVLEISGN